MPVETAHLALMLDAPMQSWGFASRFQRRTTGLHPTKSGVIGLLCAAMGIGKGTEAERSILPQLAAMNMTSLALQHDYTRVEDFHTVQGTRRASGKPNPDPVVTHRQYLLDARFGVILSGDRALLERVATAVQNPLWGVWFGRKSCVPAEPIHRGLFATNAEAHRALIGDASVDAFTTVADVASFAEGTDSFNDQPVSFGESTSSGPDKRVFATRRVKIQPGLGASAKE
jgi:CRISPR system Cascade subunit CasD